MTKWMLCVPRRRAKRTAWRAAKEALVALRRVGVVPGVKMLDQRSSRKDAMLANGVRVCCRERVLDRVFGLFFV